MQTKAQRSLKKGDVVRYSDGYIARIRALPDAPFFASVDDAVAAMMSLRGRVKAVNPYGDDDQYVRLDWSDGGSGGVLASQLTLVHKE